MRTLLSQNIVSLFLICCSSPLYGQSIRFAVIGDYGYAGQAETDVSTLVKSWNPDFIITLGDNNYNSGAASTIDRNIGLYYSSFISPYSGSYGKGDTINRFFPSLGNHDWETAGAVPYLNYFTLPGNERYYDFVKGPVHFFAIDSDPREPDSITSSSPQGRWLEKQLHSSTATWKLVYFHHPPYSSGSQHGSTAAMQWPFQTWGATAVLSGHEHNYERIVRNNFPYFVNGLGGRSRYNFGTPLSGSLVRFNADYGAMLVEANNDSITFVFRTRDDSLIDRYVMTKNAVDVSEEEATQPSNFLLEQNYPNPFNPRTDLRFDLPAGQAGIGVVDQVTLKVYDVLGREVATLVNEVKQPGSYSVGWDATGFASGVYYYRLQSGRFWDVKKLLLMK